jgi:hypothetical protein
VNKEEQRQQARIVRRMGKWAFIWLCATVGIFLIGVWLGDRTPTQANQPTQGNHDDVTPLESRQYELIYEQHSPGEPTFLRYRHKPTGLIKEIVRWDDSVVVNTIYYDSVEEGEEY